MRQRILVEGADIHLLVHVCLKMDVSGLPLGFGSEKDFRDNFLINKDKAGKKDVIKGIAPAVKDANRTTHLGIVVDADDSAQNTWQSIRAVLDKLDYRDLPPSPLPDGIVVRLSIPHYPQVGAWIMPDNQSPRAIEDFFLTLVDPDDNRMNKAKATVSEVISSKLNLFSEMTRSKADVHTWLAWQEEPGRSMGTAVKSGLLNLDHELARRFTSWFTKTFQF
ncbi:MAG: DUF3226 domain-containing protein [Saprospiraceae bacterium]